jgi:hypothetical protein
MTNGWTPPPGNLVSHIESALVTVNASYEELTSRLSAEDVLATAASTFQDSVEVSVLQVCAQYTAVSHSIKQWILCGDPPL